MVKVILDSKSRESPWRHRTGGTVAGCTVHGADAACPDPCLCPGPDPRSSRAPPPTARPGVCLPVSLPQRHYQRITEFTVRSLVPTAQTVPTWLCKLAGRGFQPLHLGTRSLRGVWEGCQVRWPAENGVYRVSEPLGRCFSAGENFVPQGTFDNVRRQFWFSQPAGERWLRWHLADRSQPYG